jgi:hypothetical protein
MLLRVPQPNTGFNESMRKFLFPLLLAAISVAQTPQRRPASATEAMYQNAASSAEKKMAILTQNAIKAQPDPTPVDFTEMEINAYLNSGRVELPKGITQLRFTGNNNHVTANTRVDFDTVTEGRGGGNPLMALFSGTHDVEVQAQAVGIRREGRVHIDSVSIDGIGVPKAALEYFVDKYIKPKYPELGIDSTFDLPGRVDSAVVGDHKLTVIQK